MSFLLLGLLVPLAFLIGIGASAIGVTAWMMLVPMLYVFFGFDLYLTLFISLSVDCGNALIMAAYAWQNGQLELKTGLRLSFIAALIVLLGIYLGTSFIPENEGMFKSPAILVNLFFGVVFIRRGYRQGKLESTPHPAVTPVYEGRGRKELRELLMYPAVFFVAVQTGLFGIGGGMMYAIFLMFCLSFSSLKATGTAMLISFLTTIIAATGVLFQIPPAAALDRQRVILMLSLVLASMVGTILSARIVYSLSLRKLNYMIAAVIIFAAVMAFVQNLLISA